MLSVYKELYYATIYLQWNPSLNSSYYTISVDSGSSAVWKATTKSTNFVLKVLYNINYTISVAATNCAGSGTPAYLSTLKIGKHRCMDKYCRDQWG